MRNILVSVILCLISLNALAQAPEKMSYQAVVRDNANALVVDKVVGMRISILRGSVSGTAAYVETQSPRSNINGLVTLEIGAGTVVSGSFVGLNWSSGPYFIQTEIDPSGGSNYSILGLSQLVSVPYALYAKTSGSSTPGPTGPAGAIGATGPIGPQGPAGVAGAAGTNGIAGAVGSQGDQGPKGDTGAAGPAGPAGANGTNGLAGPTGPQGVIGLTGPPGATGPAGANGTNGTAGAIGPQGSKGEQGTKGDKGDPGTNGTDGVPGLKGEKGDPGLQGTSGILDLATPGNVGNVLTSDGNNWISAAVLTNPSLSGLSNFTKSNYLFNTKTGVKLQASSLADHVDLVLSPKGTGAILAQEADGTAFGGNNRGLSAVDLQMLRGSNSQVASGDFAVISGGARNIASNIYAVVGGGNNNTASESYAVVGGGNNNTASESYAVVAGGNDNTANKNYTVISGGSQNMASEFYAAVGGGNQNIASDYLAVVSGGNQNTASGNSSVVAGGSANTASGKFSVVGGGIRNTAQSYGETVLGIFSTVGSGDPLNFNPLDRLFVIGNGTNTNTSSRSNAITVLKNANTTIGGSLMINQNGTNTSFLLPTDRGTSGQVLTTNGAGLSSWAGTDYQAPISLTTTGTGAATLAGATLNIPTLANGTATGDMLYWNGTAWVKVSAGKEGQVMLFGDGKPIWSSYNLGAVLGSGVVWNPKTGRIWMDKNLGAINVSSISTDSQGYGSLYQWGRGTDGHQVRTSTTTTTLSTSDTPGNPNFIKNLTDSRDWRSPSNPNLWQGVSGTNNPCPSGFRIPTESEWTAEFGTWTSANTTGAFNSVLKLTPAGGRVSYDGVLYDVGTNGYYWSSTIDVVFPADSKLLYFTNQSATINSARRENGLSVRCIKD